MAWQDLCWTPLLLLLSVQHFEKVYTVFDTGLYKTDWYLLTAWLHAQGPRLLEFCMDAISIQVQFGFLLRRPCVGLEIGVFVLGFCLGLLLCG